MPVFKLTAFTFLGVILFSGNLFSQNTFRAVVKDSITHETLIGVSAVVEGTLNGSNSDANGNIEIKNIPGGDVKIIFSLIGYKKTFLVFPFPLQAEKQITVFLSPENISLNEITVSTTRTNSRIEDLPVKMEVIGPEDVAEESSLVPGNIAGMLGDVAGLQTQQTSAVTGNNTIRIQGLDGKYTQILRDGLPLYEGFSGGFGVLDIPPLDLKQIEIIKGSASTLYGGGAIGGLINFISKEPGDSSQAVVSLNQTSLKETNLNIFCSGKNKKSGITFYTGGTYQKAVDVNDDGFSDQPKVRSISFHPKIYIYLSKNKTLTIGYSGATSENTGGDMQAINEHADSTHVYIQTNQSTRNILDVNFHSENQHQEVFTVKCASGIYYRSVKTFADNIPGNYHDPLQGWNWSVFSELSYLKKLNRHELVGGLNFISDLFSSRDLSFSYSAGDEKKVTTGIFIQDDWHFTERFTMETGLRFDRVNVNDKPEANNFLLPRISFVSKWNRHFTSRIGGGFGYRVPDKLSEDLYEKNIFTAQEFVPEKSFGANGDVNYSTIIGEVSLIVNQSFFYTRLNHPVIATDSNTVFQPLNSADHVETKGSESYIRIRFNEFELYLGYVYSLPQFISANAATPLTLAPHDKFATTCVYETDTKWKFGIEASFIGRQYIESEKKSPSYWIGALMIQKKISSLTVTANCENLFDFRQTKKEEVVIPPYYSPTFKPLWAPLTGRVINLSVKIIL